MKKTASTLCILVLCMTLPAYAGSGHHHDAAEKKHHTVDHDTARDDHSTIKALDVTPVQALALIEAGLTSLADKTVSQDGEGIISDASHLMSAVKTLKGSPLTKRQDSALTQLDQQLDTAKHAAEDKDFAKAEGAITKATSALKLYKALK